MKHFSLFKLTVALLICNVFIFCCAVTGTVSGEPSAEPSQSNESEPPNKIGGTIDFIDDNISSDDENTSDDNDNINTSTVILENLGFAKPSLTQKPLGALYRPTSSVLELTQKEPENSQTEETSFNGTSSSSNNVPSVPESSEPVVSEPDPSVPAASEPVSSEPIASEPDTSEPNTSQDEPGSSSVSTPEEPVESTGGSEQPPNTDPNEEVLRVNNNGTEVSGNAVDIITQIVENEIGSTFAPEAIKAQAVTAYTYVKYSNLRGTSPYCVLKESTNDSVRTLVQSVIGQGIYYNGELIQAVYSASSAGSTASSKNVWGGDIPYLQSVYCELDEKYDPNYGRKVTFSESEMKSRIFDNANITLSGDPATWFIIENRTEGKYVGNMKIGGQEYFVDKDGDTLRATGRRFREIIMDFDIRSSAFDIDYNSDTQEFTITTYGYGHGVGLSQNGANNLAKYWGWDYKKILTFYFQGTEVY